MKVLVDTAVWSRAFRHTHEGANESSKHLQQLIEEIRANIIGPIKQEILSGLKEKVQFNKLSKIFSSFPNINILDSDYISAAEFSNICRSEGIQGSPIDFLICAVAVRKHMAIFTLDKDFLHYEKHLPITLYKPIK